MDKPMKTSHITAAGALTLAALAGCTTMGMGGGELTAKGKPTEPVVFSWKSTDGGLTGTMVATLPDATYTGRFFEITQQTQGETLAPMWNGWNEGWYDWPYWSQPWPGTYGATQFITHYSGKVVANLQTNGGERMRCRFHLAHPSGGMSGGGQGECQLSGGRVINAAFDRG
jgi:hypothetical protein